MSDTLEVREVRVVGRKEVRVPGEFSDSSSASPQLNNWQAGDIVQLVLDHGKLKPPDIYRLLQESASDLCKPFLKLLVDMGRSTTVVLPECKERLYQLVLEGYLRPSTPLSHISPREKLIQYEVEEVGKKTGFLTAKELRQAKEAAWVRMRREEQEEVLERNGIVGA